MEQKQLDETFEGEEFVDDLEEIRVEPAHNRAKKGREAKAEAKAAEAKSAKKAKAEKHSERHGAEEKNMESKPGLESKPMVDPWAADQGSGEGAGFFSDASTWKAITGIMLVLLILAVFTQGFRFSGKGGLTGATTVSLQDAEKTAADFVNTNLLRPPFTAEVTSSADAGSLYKVTLSVAGQTVDSYVTKDGTLFFPQGFDTTKSLQEQLTGPAEGSAGAEETGAGTGEAGEVPVNVPEVSATPTIEDVKIIPVQAKKWTFQPNKITVQRGEIVQLSIIPASGFSFSFSLPDFGVGQEITGPTMIELRADKTGKFPFMCSSCEEFRGMKGTLIVE